MSNCIHVELKGKYKLVVYEFNYGLRGDVFEQVEQFKYVKVQSAKFFFKDNDATIYRVKEYFGFLDHEYFLTKINCLFYIKLFTLCNLKNK